MPTVAPSSRVKRLMCHQADEAKPNKRPHVSSRVHFDDKIEVRPSDKSDDDEPMPDAPAEVEDLDLVLTVGDDGEWDCAMTTKYDAAKDAKKRSLDDHLSGTSTAAKTHEEEEEEPLLRVASNNSLGNNLTISLRACDDAEENAEDAAAPTPLITPPSSPRRVRTLSFDGQAEEATICEWPCNLTVDNAITAAVEAGPLALPVEE